MTENDAVATMRRVATQYATLRMRLALRLIVKKSLINFVFDTRKYTNTTERISASVVRRYDNFPWSTSLGVVLEAMGRQALMRLSERMLHSMCAEVGLNINDFERIRVSKAAVGELVNWRTLPKSANMCNAKRWIFADSSVVSLRSF